MPVAPGIGDAMEEIEVTNAAAQGGSRGLKLDHVAIMVPDVDEGVDWYREMFDAGIIDRWENPEAGMKWAHLSIGDFVLELVQMPALEEKSARIYAYHHIALRVEDCDSLTAELQGRGVEVLVPPNDFDRHNTRWCFVKDYQGNTIELISDRGEAAANG